MKISNFLFLLILLSLSSCRDIEKAPKYQKLQTELNSTIDAMDIMQAKFKALKKEKKNLLVHQVYFKLKPDLSAELETKLIDAIKKLKKIEVLKYLEVGRFQDLGDQRAMSDYGVMMQMGFTSEADYKTYQNHELHLELKANVGQYLGGPPVTYDYWMK